MAKVGQSTRFMRKLNFKIKNFVVATVLLFSGCSTFEVKDTYKLSGNYTHPLHYDSEDIKLNVGINPDKKFYSIGMLGIPVFPTYLGSSEQTELSLGVSLRLYKDYTFSFSTYPCLDDKASSLICPTRVDVSARGMFQDDGTMYEDKQRRWQHMTKFFDHSKKGLTFFPNSETRRVDRNQIYKHYDYTGTPKWDYLRVDIEYIYPCEEVCPEELSLDAKDIVWVENTMFEHGIYTFKRSREKDYEVITPLQ